MSKATKGLSWLRDLIQIFFLDRFSPQRKRFSMEASTACRSLRFHAHCKIRPKPLAEVLGLLSQRAVEKVVLAGPSTDLGDVGSQTYYHTLACLVQALQPRTILEFGTYLGVSAYTMALNTPDSCRIFTVDLPDNALAELVPGLNEIDRGHISTSRRRVGEAFLDTPFQRRITQIRADSLAFAAQDHLQEADLVFVDGGHSLPVLTKDSANAFRVLAPKGTILWDDYFHLYPDVVSYLDGLADRYKLHGIAGTNFVIHHAGWQ